MERDSQKSPQILGYGTGDSRERSGATRWMLLAIPLTVCASAFTMWLLENRRYLDWLPQWDWDAICFIVGGCAALWFLALRVLLFSRAAPFWQSMQIAAASAGIIGCFPLALAIRDWDYKRWWPPGEWSDEVCWAAGLIGASVGITLLARLGDRLTRARNSTSPG